MKCPECGAEMKIVHEDHPYEEAGLPHVVLQGVEIRVCPNGDERELVIPRMAQLHRTIVDVLAKKHTRLVGAEIRFLRKHLGFSGKDFAEVIGVDPATISRWENDKEWMGAQTERLLRLMAIRDQPVDSYPNERLAGVAQGSPEAAHMSLKAIRDRWQIQEQPTA